MVEAGKSEAGVWGVGTEAIVVVQGVGFLVIMNDPNVPFGLLRLGHRLLDLLIEHGEFLLDAGLPLGVVATVVGANIRAIEHHLIEADQAHLHCHAADVAEEGLQLQGELRAEVADRRVIRLSGGFAFASVLPSAT